MSIRAMAVTALAAALMAVGCDPQGMPIEHWGIDRLAPGVSTVADVRGVFGVPDSIVEERDGSRVMHYPQAPQDTRTFFAVIGADGKLVRVWNVLVPETVAQVKPGMLRDDVRLLLGRHGAEQSYPLKRQTAWERKIIEDNSIKVFYVIFDEAGKVVASACSGANDAGAEQAAPAAICS